METFTVKEEAVAGWFLKAKMVGIQHSWNRASEDFKETITQEQFKKISSPLDIFGIRRTKLSL